MAKKLSKKDREIKRLIQWTDVPIPKKVELSIDTLNRLADHCEATGRKLSYHGMKII